MPDSPDYQKYLPGSNRFSLQDLGELAARLGSPIVYDRRGEVVWYDDFSHGVSNYAGVAVLNALYPFRSPYCAKLSVAAGGAGDASLGYQLPIFGSGRAGFEIGFAVIDNFSKITVSFEYDLTSTPRVARWQYDTITRKFRILDEATGWVDVSSNITDQFSPPAYHDVKVVGDFATNQYVRVVVDGTEYDVSAYELSTDGELSIGRSEFIVTLENDATHAVALYDGFGIVTANEP